jgi:tRNA(Ile2) C34 agmatinyltransferase TiaS
MVEQRRVPDGQKLSPKAVEKSVVKRLWQDQEKTCQKCPYCGQDVDSYPCDRCHTRH